MSANRPDGPHNAPPIAPPSQGARAPAARPVEPPRAPAGHGGRFAPPNGPEPLDVVALRTRAATAAAAAVNHQRAAPGAAPPDPGTVLASIARPDGTQLRVSAHTYEGRPFVRVAPWATRDGGSTWWPVKGKGASVKVRELAAVAAALLDALDVVGNDGPSKPQREVR